MTSRAVGIDTDVSQYNSGSSRKPLTPRYADLSVKPDFVIVKMSEGTYVDPHFMDVYSPLAQPASIRGVYHYQRSGVSWQLQADNLLMNLPSDCNIIALDVEKINNTMDAGFFADSSRILRYWAANSKCKVIYYTGQDVYMNYMLPVMNKWYPMDKWYLDFPMWVASWPLFKPSRSADSNPSLPKGMRGDWKFMQWTDAGDQPKYAKCGSPDLDVFNGQLQDLLNWLGYQTPSTPLPPVSPSSVQTVITKQVSIMVTTSDPNSGVDVKII